jgi:hypothetical protein
MTLRNVALRAAAWLIATASAALPSLAAAQEWVLQSGLTARGEYNDNYFLTTRNKESAFTATVSPFVTAARRTEASEVVALLSVGANKVWGLSDTTDYLSGRLGLNGLLRDARSTWTGSVSFSRAPALQNEVSQRGTILALVFTNAANVNGGYQYALTERWSLGARAGALGNWYEDIQNSNSTGSPQGLQDNWGYYAGGQATYAYSALTQITLAGNYSYFASDVTRSGGITTTLGIVHQFSPQLTVSASGGVLWTDIEATQTALVCPTTPTLCDSGVVPRMPITSGESRRDSGTLYGGNISYSLSDRTRFLATLTESLTPSSTGTVSKTDSAGATLLHRFSERLTGRLGATYVRTVFPTGISGLSTTNTYTGQAGISYMLDERWKLDVGYRYLRAEYAQTGTQTGTQPQSNAVFVTIGYNWPGASSTDWVGPRLDTQGAPGAGPVPLSQTSTLIPGGAVLGTAGKETPGDTRTSPLSPKTSPFDQFSIP